MRPSHEGATRRTHPLIIAPPAFSCDPIQVTLRKPFGAWRRTMVVICQEPGCQKQAKYGEAGCKKRLFCSEHGAAKGLQRVSSHRPCSFPDCSRLARGTTQFCARHRRELHARLAEGERTITPAGPICSSIVDTSSPHWCRASRRKMPLSAMAYSL